MMIKFFLIHLLLRLDDSQSLTVRVYTFIKGDAVCTESKRIKDEPKEKRTSLKRTRERERERLKNLHIKLHNAREGCVCK